MISYAEVAAQFVRYAEETESKNLYLIVDLCNCNSPLLAAIQSWQPPLQFCLLFEHTPETHIKEDGPLLLRLDVENENHLEILEKICEITHLDNRLLGFNSDFPFGTLETHLRKALNVRWGKKEGVLRYYAPDLFSPLNDVLTNAQKSWLHQYIWHWFFVDEEGEWGSFTPEYPECEQDQFDIGGLIFSQEQYDTLLLWAEAYTFRRKHALGLDAFDYGGEKLLIKQLYVLALEADKQLIFDEAERVLYMKDNLKKIL